ncbi:hypothetical protein ACFXI8_32600 [Streptomyces niveus]|uniref:hypothetical protein n=1 Tax=Streptomyces niveus TaxID=193462 RepID=UPI003678DB69
MSMRLRIDPYDRPTRKDDLEVSPPGEATHPAPLDATGIGRRRTADGPHILTDTTEWVLEQ